MIIQKILFLGMLFLSTLQSLCATFLEEQFKHNGYVEMCNDEHGTATFDALYKCFDELIEFLQTHPVWAQKLNSAKQRFIRTKDKNLYATDFFGLYDESQRNGRSQISFYYATHFHDFICARYPEFNKIPEIMLFLEACREIQQPYEKIFHEAAAELRLEEIFSFTNGNVPQLLKVVKYLPTYRVSAPHYDGSAFSLFLDSTDNQSLLLAPYKNSFTPEDFASPTRTYARTQQQNSLLLIPGVLLPEFSINPTPHLVAHSNKTRYATIAFAMRPNYLQQKNEFSLLPRFNR